MSAAELREMEEETAIAAVSKESVSIYNQVQALQVVDQRTHDIMHGLYEASKAIEKAVHEAHDPVCEHWHKMHKQATAAREADLGKVTIAKKESRRRVDAWEMEQERLRLEAERKAQEEARRIAEEQARIAREAAEAERRRIEAEEEAERLRLAEDAEASGATAEEVTEILATPLYEAPVIVPEPVAPVVMPTVAPTFQKAAGFAARWNYSANMNSVKEMAKAAAANDHFLQYLQFNEKAVNALARATKDAFSLPGCTLKKERV